MSNTVPEGWSLQPLSALANYHNGRAFKPDDWSLEGLPIIRIAQINNRNADLDYYAGDDVSEKNIIRNGDLLFSWSATLTALIWDRGDAVLNQHIFKVEEKTGVNRSFLHQLILNSIEPLAEHSHGSTMKHIKKSVLDEYCVETPPLPEQEKIAAILSSADDVIEKTRAQIDKLKDLKTGMMQELLTKGIGSGSVPHTEFKDSPVGRIPVNWSIVTIADCTTRFYQGINTVADKIVYTAKGTPIIQAKHMTSGHLNLDDTRSVSDADYEKYKQKFQPCESDILFSNIGTIGKSVIIEREDQFLIAWNVFLMRIEKYVTPKYMHYTLQYLDWLNFYDDLMTGNATKFVNKSSLGSISIRVPPREEQKNITASIGSVDNRLKHSEQKLYALVKFKKALMQDLLTGKVRVKVDQKESAVA